MTYFIIGYFIVWGVLFGYIALLHHQQNRMERRLGLLEEMLEEKDATCK